MKKRKVIFFALALSIIAMCSGFAQDFAGKRIVVIEPEIVNSNESVSWIPLFVQGLITTNLQNYSKMEVIDRQNLDKVKAEQRLSENSANSEEEALELGKLASAQYIVTVKMINKNSNFALDCKITDAETSKLVGKTYSNPNCSQDAIENGDAINEASRQLLIGLGIPESSLTALITTTDSTPKQQQAVKSNAALAKGIAAENVSKNVVTALSYYQDALSADASLTEANDRLANLTSVVSTGNMREDIKNDIALRKEWIKIIDDLKTYLDKNLYITLYDPKLEVANINYETEKADLSMSAFIGLNPKALKVMATIMEGFEKVNKDSWGINLDYSRYVAVYFYLYDENNIWFSTASCGKIFSKSLTDFSKYEKEILELNDTANHLSGITADEQFEVQKKTESELVPDQKNKKQKNKKQKKAKIEPVLDQQNDQSRPVSSPVIPALNTITFKNIDYGRITDSISVALHHYEILTYDTSNYSTRKIITHRSSLKSSITVDEYTNNGGIK